MKALAEKRSLTDTYRVPDPSGLVQVSLSDFGQLHRALVEAVHELERFYGD